MKRTIIAATAAALLASATFGIAAPNYRGAEHPRPSPEQMAENASAMTDARIAALKAGLRLTADQEKLWPALETALRASADQRIEARKQWREQREARRGQEHRGPAQGGPDGPGGPGAPGGPLAGGPEGDVVARLQQRADRMLERGSALKGLADAAAPLYATLNPAQQHRFNRLFREAEGPHMAFRDGPRERRWEGHGPHRFGPPGPGMHRPPAPDEPERL